MMRGSVRNIRLMLIVDMTSSASGGCPHDGVVVCVMARYAACYRSAKATLSQGRRGGERQRYGKDRGGGQFQVHGNLQLLEFTDGAGW